MTPVGVDFPQSPGESVVIFVFASTHLAIEHQQGVAITFDAL